MEIIAGIAGLITGALAAWSIARARAAAELTRFQVQVAERIGYWRDEAQRAKATAARARVQAACRAAGCREDALSLARAPGRPAGRRGDDAAG